MGLASPEKTPLYSRFIIFHNFARFVTKLVEIMINKAVVGSSHGDVPKYVGEGVALYGTPGALGVPLPWFSCLSTAVLGKFMVGTLQVRQI